MERNVICIKWGDRYSSDYVNRLFRAVSRNMKSNFNFACFTDQPKGMDPGITTFPIPPIEMPSWALSTGWRKLCLFSKDLPISGQCLFLDLDLVVSGPLDDFFCYEPASIAIIRNWVGFPRSLWKPKSQIGNSSVFRFEARKLELIEKFYGEMEWALQNFSPPQAYLTHCINKYLKFWPDPWVKSFKRHCRPAFPFNYIMEPRIPKGASIIAFHGKPDPHEVLANYKGKKVHHFSKACSWVHSHWA